MSTFRKITNNTITNSGETISGKLLYSWLDGENESKPVYFCLEDENGKCDENLSTKGTSAFYLTFNISGCTAQVKDSTATSSSADANIASEIWLNIPSITTSRTIQFSWYYCTYCKIANSIENKI